MNITRTKCDNCGKEFYKDARRVNESKKRNWKIFCSSECYKKERTKAKDYKCCNPNCGETIIRKLSAVVSPKRVFCNHTCAASYLNKHRKSNPVSERYQARMIKQPICLNPSCNQKIGLWSSKYCSTKCRRITEKLNQSRYQQSVLDFISKFHKANGRIPMKAEATSIYYQVRLRFGTWNNAIKAAGFNPNPVRFAKHYYALDGHYCDSMSEKIVDDWLFTHHVPHLIHVSYPWNNGMSADFKVDDYWVELFGLAGELKVYDDLKAKKLDLIKQHKLKLITLIASDAFKPNMLDLKLSCLLKYSKNHFSDQLSVL